MPTARNRGNVPKQGAVAGTNVDTASVAHAKAHFARFQLVFGLIFTLAALAFGVLFVVRPALQMRAARAWTQTPCVITQSVVVRKMGSSRTNRPSRPSYSLSLSYEYQLEGRAYRSTTYAFDATTVTGFEASHQLAARLPVGTATICFVNPSQPGEAVLKRDAQQPRWMLLVPMILLGAGLAITYNALQTRRQN